VRNPEPDRCVTALASLRRFVRPRAIAPCERCALCGVKLADEHPHLVEVANRRLACACNTCALLFDGTGSARYRRVPRRASLLDFRLTDEAWEALNLPINLAFFVRSTPAGAVIALYPSPAGATESPVAAEAWESLAEENPVLMKLQPDIEGLLVNRVGDTRECFIVGLDECYRLVGLIRLHWRGLSGGAAAWDEIGRYFAELRGRASHA
jgi:hypothetical protein